MVCSLKSADYREYFGEGQKQVFFGSLLNKGYRRATC
jgi:hypothetical protein